MEKPNGERVIREKANLHEKKVKELFNKGYSYRQIQKTLGFKSVSSVDYFLKRKSKKSNNKN